MEKEIKTTERQIGQFREQLSRIIRQVDMIDKGKTHTKDGGRRLDIIVECAKNIDSQCKVMALNRQFDSKLGLEGTDINKVFGKMPEARELLENDTGKAKVDFLKRYVSDRIKENLSGQKHIDDVVQDIAKLFIDLITK